MYSFGYIKQSPAPVHRRFQRLRRLALQASRSRFVGHGWIVTRTSDVHQITGLISGPVVSSMVNVAVVPLPLPQSSVAVKVTVAYGMLRAIAQGVESLLHVTPLQASDASHHHCWQPCIEISCVAGAVAFNRRIHRFGIHRWVCFVFDGERRGCAAAVPQSSVAVNTVAMPVAPQSSLKASKSCSITLLHASDAIHRHCWRAMHQGPLRCQRRRTQPTRRMPPFPTGASHQQPESADRRMNVAFPQWSVTVTENVRVKLNEPSQSEETGPSVMISSVPSLRRVSEASTTTVPNVKPSVHTAPASAVIRISRTGQREHRSFVVYQCDGLNERAAVAAVVHRRIRADVRTNWGDTSRIAFRIFKCDEYVATVIGGRSIQREVWPVGTAHLNALFCRKHRRRFIHYRDGLRGVRCVAAIVRSCERTNNRVCVGACIVQDDFLNQADRDIAASIFCGRVLVHQLRFTRNRVIGWHEREGRCC